MLHSTTEKTRLYLTAELRAVDALALPALDMPPSRLFASDMRRFPPVEDVVALLDRIASRAFAA
jgi:hypothetical protein